MTKYLYDVPFSTPAATDAYREGWDAIFAKKPGEKPAEGGACPCESGEAFEECHGKTAPTVE